MPLRSMLRLGSRPETGAAPDAPLCGAEPGPARWQDRGAPFPEYTERHPFPCTEPATVFAEGSCPCGHGGSIRLCATHAAAPADEQNCGPCADEYGHRCLVTFTLIPQ